MRDRHQDSDVAQSGRPKKETDDDGVGEVGDSGAVPEAIAPETTYAIVRPHEAAGVHPVRGDRERADTDRDEPRGELSGELLAARKVPTGLTFHLRAVRSNSASCFFCKGTDCDQVFVAKTKDASKIKAFAVHNQCVFDHEELQALA